MRGEGGTGGLREKMREDKRKAGRRGEWEGVGESGMAREKERHGVREGRTWELKDMEGGKELDEVGIEREGRTWEEEREGHGGRVRDYGRKL